jgi:hypothetical protein
MWCGKEKRCAGQASLFHCAHRHRAGRAHELIFGCSEGRRCSSIIQRGRGATPHRLTSAPICHPSRRHRSRKQTRAAPSNILHQRAFVPPQRSAGGAELAREGPAKAAPARASRPVRQQLACWIAHVSSRDGARAGDSRGRLLRCWMCPRLSPGAGAYNMSVAQPRNFPRTAWRAPSRPARPVAVPVSDGGAICRSWDALGFRHELNILILSARLARSVSPPTYTRGAGRVTQENPLPQHQPSPSPDGVGTSPRGLGHAGRACPGPVCAAGPGPE